MKIIYLSAVLSTVSISAYAFDLNAELDPLSKVIETAKTLNGNPTVSSNAAADAVANQTCRTPPSPPASQFQSLGDGSQAKDLKTKLIWMRCIEGQDWTGSVCKARDPNAVNPGPGLSYADAQAMAKRMSTGAKQWRLPTKRELETLRASSCYNPSLNLEVFPTAPAWSSDGFFWTSTPEKTLHQGMWLVSAIGTSDSWEETGPEHRNHVRLVRVDSK